ncbi:phospholipase A1 [Drosophila mojavensis]|uniref:Lipase domain-containing protein n=1 Tax=Drosophila mojavensis TaxID=7230 RepID=B4KEJ4_DROMO|nr:phospholipase A1 [Drosophila mojavensis]EDW11873.1 uncharacterized protein Dmoj_GI17384 [Drosophila mojavensis]
MKLLLLVVVISSFGNARSNCPVVEAHCPNVYVQFWLYSKNKIPKLIDPAKLNRNIFQHSGKIVILIHGYTGNRNSPPNNSIRPAFLNHTNVDVISVDYAPLVKSPCFAQAVQNVPLVSKCLAQLINVLVRRDIVHNSDLHLIGFSLGAQVAAQTSNYVFKKLKHITALDPAKPLFISADKMMRLDKADAEYVDVIHTDTLQYGLLKRVGHADFYPNFGQLQQPGCVDAEDKTSCNHNRAPLFYAESIIPNHNFWGRSSKDPSQIVLMGYGAPLVNGTFFLKTGSEFPFALKQEDSIANAEFGFNQMKRSFITYIEKALETYLISQISNGNPVKARTTNDNNNKDREENTTPLVQPIEQKIDNGMV